MSDSSTTSRFTSKDLTAGLVVYLVALPLCLGIAGASGTSYASGILAGVIGGLVVGLISGSHTSVSGPAAGLVAVVIAQVAALGSFETFLLALFLAGLIQIGMGVAKLGFLSAFVPTSVIKGLLTAIGVLLILKQVPHLLGHDNAAIGDDAYLQADGQSTFSELGATFQEYHLGAALVGIVSLAALILWDKSKRLKYSPIPGPLVAVLVGIGIAELLRNVGGSWVIAGNHLVSLPVIASADDAIKFLTFPDWSALANHKVYIAAVTIAIVASLETLLNLEAVDRLDPRKRESPSSRELVAQGVGNSVAGLVGGLPITSVVVRGSVNVSMGATSKWSAVTHGVLLCAGVLAFPSLINRIPLSSLAAILLTTGFKLASPAVFKSMYRDGRQQFLPFIITVVAIVMTDLLIGILIGLAVSICFVLYSNMKRPLRRIVEKHPGGDLLRIVLGNQVSFLNKAVIERALLDVPSGGHVLIDAGSTEYIDPDVRKLIEEFKESVGPARDVVVSLSGFDASRHGLKNEIRYIDYVDRHTQGQLTPDHVIEILKEGNERFRSGKPLTRDLNRQVNGTSAGQHPMAVVLSCIDSRAPSELVFDLGLGDIFSARIAGNVISRKGLGSLEYACAVGGAKLLLVMGHTRCGAITEAVRCLSTNDIGAGAYCSHLQFIVDDISPSVDDHTRRQVASASPEERERLVDQVAQQHVSNVIETIRSESAILSQLEHEGKIKIVAGMYDVRTGEVVLSETATGQATVLKTLV